MLRQVFVIQKDDIVYQRMYANALSINELDDLLFKIKRDAKKESAVRVDAFDYYKYRVCYDAELDLNTIFIFITGLMDDFFGLIKTEMSNFKKKFQEILTEDVIGVKITDEITEELNEYLDFIHKNIKPKIAVVGYSGVGKSTIKNLIKKDEIPQSHIPTISGDIAYIEIGKLQFTLFDFAGQEQFEYLWKGFIKGSNAVLVVTDSSPLNVEKSEFFVKLRNDEAPSARLAIIANKQDQENAWDPEHIENILGIKTYSMIANNGENRDKMINIIAEVLDINIGDSPLLGKLVDIQHIPEKPENKGIKEEIIDQTSQYIKNVNIDQNLLNEVVNDIKGVKIKSILRNYHKMMTITIKTLNNGEELSFQEFYELFNAYTERKLSLQNFALKQFLESQFARLQKAIEDDEFIATKLKDDKDAIINALCCAYLAKSNPELYIIFDNILNDLTPFKGFNVNTINDIESYFLRITKKY